MEGRNPIVRRYHHLISSNIKTLRADW